jgi:RNA polymerase sigma factor (sigma-70 family)
MEQNYSRNFSQNNSDQITAQLFEAFKNGDLNAFSQLYDLHAGMLYNYGYRLTTDMELLKDCIQDVFIKIYNKRTELGPVVNFKSYIFISLKNKLCDESRKRIHLTDTAVEEFDTVASENVEIDYLAAEKKQNDNSLVSRLLGYLSPRQRKAIELYYIEERKYEDICDIMQMNYQSVRNLIHRGMTRLRTCACL